MFDSHHHAVMEIRYGIHYNAANERLYRRLRLIFDTLSIVSGSAAFGGWLADKPSMIAWAGLAIAITSAVNQIVSPAEAAAKHNEAYRAFTDLNARAENLSMAEIGAEIAKIRAGSPWGVDALGTTAFNRCLTANGYTEGFLPVSSWQRLISILV